MVPRHPKAQLGRPGGGVAVIEYRDMVQQIATQVKRQFHMVERDDIVQELWLWLAEHTERVEEYASRGKHGERQLATALRRAGRAFAIKEKAAIVGYDLDDLYWYSTAQLRELLPLVMDRSLWVETGVPAETGRVSSTSDPAHGNNRLAILCDIRASLETCSERDKLLLWTHFGLGMEEDEHALTLGITTETLRKRVTRALQRLQRALGGPRPDQVYVGTRRALSNAQAQAITRNQEAEE